MARTIKIKNDEVIQLLGRSLRYFPKYSTQIMNLANSNAQGTRPRVVGQMSELIQEFPGKSIQEWEQWYKQKKPNAIRDATEKVLQMIEHFKSVIHLIDEKLIHAWIEDLVITKTYSGLKFQEAILRKVADIKQTTYKLSTPEDESKGIDGFIDERPVSIKPLTYQAKRAFLSEEIGVDMIYYDKKKDGINVSYNP